MAYYMKYSTDIYNIYLKYISSDDILVYSIDEVFMDITNYISFYKCSPAELITKIIKDVYDSTKITATAGIGTNMYLAKVAMDIVAKKCDANEFGVRIAFLDEKTYRKKLWNHKPLTDFWRVGKGIAKTLEKNNMFTMGDVAKCSHYNEDLLYKLFGVNAELLIDHAWGYEPCTIKIAKSYKPINTSLSSGQVLHEAYDYETTKIIIKEMADNLALDLVSKKLVTDQIVLTIEYDTKNLSNHKEISDIKFDRYGRKVPKPSHGTISLDFKTSSSNILMNYFIELYDKICNKNYLIRKLNLSVNRLTNEDKIKDNKKYEQLNLFLDSKDISNKLKISKEQEIKDKEIQKVILKIKNKYGKNSILKAMDIQSKATAMERNKQIGGHHE